MADIKYYDVILKPVITEKSMAGMGEKKYTFLVHPEANKTQIKEAVEKMFEGAKVAKVNTLNADGKNKLPHPARPDRPGAADRRHLHDRGGAAVARLRVRRGAVQEEVAAPLHAAAAARA